ncbi:hypothetical protein P280DRAFT_143911 [Massarina eburnea CBS 473.64]|uniref:Transmembrane protein n=1 Tax=Massarina eburnea CBS 473.64 TaxID=1395130 RepID=A0A6A6RNF1_9PLEO|nr:hypothetical protein P280DRAFT_143911 [Massarina eburnea CBS 473.64]
MRFGPLSQQMGGFYDFPFTCYLLACLLLSMCLLGWVGLGWVGKWEMGNVVVVMLFFLLRDPGGWGLLLLLLLLLSCRRVFGKFLFFFFFFFREMKRETKKWDRVRFCRLPPNGFFFVIDALRCVALLDSDTTLILSWFVCGI